MQRSILLFIVFALALLLVPPNLNAAPERPASNVAAPLTLQAVAGKIDRQVLASLQRGERTRALIVLAQQADVSAAKIYAPKPKRARMFLTRCAPPPRKRSRKCAAR